MINNQNFIFFNIHKSATLNKSNRVATGNRLSRMSRDWSVVYASLQRKIHASNSQDKQSI